MQPRDLIRHVLAPRDPKNPNSHLRDSKSNVVRSIDFVNVSQLLSPLGPTHSYSIAARLERCEAELTIRLQYLADWVASMLLVQSKLKSRARLLEKFIAIAYCLREQENFDSLMGVLAGLNAQPIFRLAETMALVSLKLERDKTKMPKRLRSLNKLMAVSKSFSAYRIALANSSAPHMLPYLSVPLLFPVQIIADSMHVAVCTCKRSRSSTRSNPTCGSDSSIGRNFSRWVGALPSFWIAHVSLLTFRLTESPKAVSSTYRFSTRMSVLVLVFRTNALTHPLGAGAIRSLLQLSASRQRRWDDRFPEASHHCSRFLNASLVRLLSLVFAAVQCNIVYSAPLDDFCASSFASSRAIVTVIASKRLTSDST